MTDDLTRDNDEDAAASGESGELVTPEVPTARPRRAREAGRDEFFSVERVQEWEVSPFPSARTLRDLEHALPGAGERAFQMAEREQTHRMRLERTGQEIFASAFRRGQIFTFLTVLALLAVAVILILSDYTKIGGGVIVADLLFAVYALADRQFPFFSRDDGADAEPESDVPARRDES